MHLCEIVEGYRRTIPTVGRSRRGNRQTTDAKYRIAMPARAIAGRTTSNFDLMSNGRSNHSKFGKECYARSAPRRDLPRDAALSELYSGRLPRRLPQQVA